MYLRRHPHARVALHGLVVHAAQAHRLHARTNGRVVQLGRSGRAGRPAVGGRSWSCTCSRTELELKLLEERRRAELLCSDSTLIVFSSDNGGPVYFGGGAGANNWPLRGGKVRFFGCKSART